MSEDDGAAGDGSELEGSPQLYLEFSTTHLRFPLDEVFMKGGGSIAGAGARGSTLLMLTGADHSLKVHLTESPSTIRLEVPKDEWAWNDKDSVTLSNRLHMMMCSELNATPAVNVTLGESISGELGVKVSTLFDRKVEGKIVPASGVATSHYGAWLNSDNAYGFRDVRFVSGDGDEFAPHFEDNLEKNERMRSVGGTKGLLQAKYDHSWKVREAVILPQLKNLTKPVASVAYGLDKSGYVPSFAVANRKFPHSAETLEDLLRAAVSTDLANEDRINDFCTTASGIEASRYAGSVVTAISLITNSLMPYRSDGTITTLSGNQIAFKQSELWTNHATNSPFRTDDCDGSAAKGVGTALAIMDYAEGSDPKSFPFLVASAKALAHYTPAVAVLAANAGHADDANASKSNIAGHAVAVFVKNVELLRGLQESSTSAFAVRAQETPEQTTKSGGGNRINVSSAGSDEDKGIKLANVRLEAMYPPSLLAKLPTEEAACIREGWNSLYTSKLLDSIPNFLVAEGTSPCASRIYTHDAVERNERATASDASNEVLTSLAPSVMRAYRWLDSSPSGEHKFYVSFAELALPPTTGLYTHPELRASGDATAHLVLTQPPVDGTVSVAGATPKQLATGAYSAIPLFTMTTAEGELFDEAMEENERNTMRPPRGVHALNELQSLNLSESLSSLEQLRSRIPRAPTGTDVTEATWLVSFAALANNPNGINVFIDEVSRIKGVSGEVEIRPIRGLAVHHDDNSKEMGTYVALCLVVPRR